MVETPEVRSCVRNNISLAKIKHCSPQSCGESSLNACCSKTDGFDVVLGAIGFLVFIVLSKRTPETVAVKPPMTGVAPPASGGTASGNVPATLSIYTNELQNGWQERGWAKVVDYANTTPVHGSGGTSIRIEAAPYEGAKIYDPTANLSSYKYLVLYLSGGKAGGQTLQLCVVAGGKTQPGLSLAALPANKWVRVAVPMSDFGVQGRSDVKAFWVQNMSGDPVTYYMDDISFRKAAPETVPEETLTTTVATAPVASP